MKKSFKYSYDRGVKNMENINKDETIKAKYKKTLTKFKKVVISTSIIYALTYIICTKFKLGTLSVIVYSGMAMYLFYFVMVEFKCPKCGFPLRGLHFFLGKCTNCKSELK